MQIIGTLNELDQKLQEVNCAAADSDAAVRSVFAGFEMDFAKFNSDMPDDPFSKEYFAFQMDIYKAISGKNYDVANEASPFDVKTLTMRPFPYSSGSTGTAGTHLSALGFVISNMKLPPGARILEFGPGWGNTTLALALLGFQVTAVDIEKNFCELIRHRAILNGVSVEVINADFFSCETVPDAFDAVLFYECFHHCSDHMRLLRGLHHAIKPNGRLYLGAEPIKPDFPLPWGLRLDGESLWAIRGNGWMELGFNDTYFIEAMRRTGWVGSCRVSQDVGWANLWEIERLHEQDVFISASDPCIQTIAGIAENATIGTRFGGTGYITYGPRLTLGAGAWRGCIHLKPGSLRQGEVHLDICSDFGERIYASTDLDLSQMDGDDTIIGLSFVLPDPCFNVEIRLLNRVAATVSVTGVEFIRPQDHSSRKCLDEKAAE